MEIARAFAVSLPKMFCDVPLLKWASALIGAALGYVFPEQATQNAAAAAAALIIADTITGVAGAIAQGKMLTSKAFSRTLAKLLGYSCVLLVCATVTRHVPGLGDFQTASVGGAVTLIILTESISILENVQRMGLTLPFGLSQLLQKRLGESREDSKEKPHDP